MLKRDRLLQLGNLPNVDYATILALNTSLAAALAASQGVADAVSCAPINGVWNKMLDAICNKVAGEGFITGWALFIVLGVLLFNMIMFAFPICRKHPSDRSVPSSQS
jgi:hypothetical protein